MRLTLLVLAVVLNASACATRLVYQEVEYGVLDKVRKARDLQSARLWLDEGQLEYALTITLEDGERHVCLSSPEKNGPADLLDALRVALIPPRATSPQFEIKRDELIEIGSATDSATPRFLLAVTSDELLSEYRGETIAEDLPRAEKRLSVSIYRVFAENDDGARLSVELLSESSHELPFKEVSGLARALAHVAFLPLYAIGAALDAPLVAGTIILFPVFLPYYLSEEK